MGVIIEGYFDTYSPRRPAKDKATEIAVCADVAVLKQVERWAIASRQATEARGVPLAPSVRVQALLALAAIKGQPLL